MLVQKYIKLISAEFVLGSTVSLLGAKGHETPLTLCRGSPEVLMLLIILDLDTSLFIPGVLEYKSKMY